MTAPLSELADRLVGAALKAGADAVDVLVISGTSVSVDVRAGALEQAERSESTDLGLRVLVGKRQANVSASDLSDRTIGEMAERAVTMARLAPEDPYAGLAPADQLATQTDASALDLWDDSPEPAPDALEAAAREAEAAALSVSGVSQVQSASASHSRRELHLATSNGFAAGYRTTGNALSCVAISGSGTGMERDYDYDSRTYLADLRSAAEIGQSAGTRAKERAGARKPATGSYPVLFDERVASGLIGHLLSAINGTAIARGSSFLRGKLGQQVLPEALSLTEDPLRPRIQGSRPFDGEGLPTSRRQIVADGILQTWTLDLATARQLGLQSTANAGRSLSAPPSPTVTHVELTQGSASREDLIRDMGTGLLVTSMIGSTINPNTGDYSRGASGFWVENGEIAYPVNECTISDNLVDMLLRIVPANDARPQLSRVVPSILIDRMTIAGT